MTTTLKLKKGEERRLQAGHLWVYSNEIDVSATPLKSLAPGQSVQVLSSRGEMLGTAYANPHSLICARLCSRQALELDAGWFHQRVSMALALRQRIFTKPFYRLVHGEGDFLPGIVIDRYDDILVVQVTTAGIESRLPMLMPVLEELLAPAAILLRNDTAVRQLEQLDSYQKCWSGQAPEVLGVIENDLDFRVPSLAGQKTGWFYDHRDNRHLLTTLANGCRVLDGYSYAGAWGINALAGGAREVLALDSSETALASAIRNARLNGFEDRYRTWQTDVPDGMRQLADRAEKFDLVVLDPPAFIKRRKDFKAGLQHYQQNIRQALALLEPGGLLFMASCSQPLSADDLAGAVRRAARQRGLAAQILFHLQQAPDHPVQFAMPETRYLKGLAIRVFRL